MHELGLILFTISIFTLTFSTEFKSLLTNITNSYDKDKAEIVILEYTRRRSKGDEFKFHIAAGNIYDDPSNPLWNPSKARFHYEQAAQGNHHWKSAALLNYATKLTKGYHQCDNHNCTEHGKKRCEKCKNTHYCSRECQIQHWNVHKSQCEAKKLEKQQRYVKVRNLLDQAIQIEMEQGFTNIPEPKSVRRIHKVESIEIDFRQYWKSKDISHNSLYSLCVWQLSELLSDLSSTQFNETQRIIELISNALKYETGDKMKKRLYDRLGELLANEQTMLEAVHRQNREDKNKFHHAVANVYAWHGNPPNPLWNPSKAFHHFEKSIQGNHFFFLPLIF